MNFPLILRRNGLRKTVKKCKHLTIKTRKKCKPKIDHPISPKKEESHLNYAQAVAFLQISKPTFTKLRNQGKIKGLKVGARRVLFNRSELEQYLQDNHE